MTSFNKMAVMMMMMMITSCLSLEFHAIRRGGNSAAADVDTVLDLAKPVQQQAAANNKMVKKNSTKVR
jgi:hypothetical protein